MYINTYRYFCLLLISLFSVRYRKYLVYKDYLNYEGVKEADSCRASSVIIIALVLCYIYNHCGFLLFQTRIHYTQMAIIYIHILFTCTYIYIFIKKVPTPPPAAVTRQCCLLTIKRENI